MSHTVVTTIDFTRRDLLKAACERLGLSYQDGNHTIKLYAGNENVDFSVTLPGWRYPIGIRDTQVVFDNYNGAWGDNRQLTKLQNYYGAEIAKEQAALHGYFVEEDATDEFSLVLTVTDYT